MIYFTAEEIYASILYAAAYGALFAAFYQLIKFIVADFYVIKFALKSTFKYKRIFEAPNLPASDSELIHNTLIHRITLFLAITLYGVGFIFLSYMTLDGYYRLYMLGISLLAIGLTNYILRKTALVILERIFKLMIYLVVYIFRIFFHPIIKIHTLYIEKNRNKCENLPNL